MKLSHAAVLTLCLLMAWPVQGWALPDPGEIAPEFALQPLTGGPGPVTSGALLKGKTTLLSFFTTWCAPCKTEIPELRGLAEKYGDRGFQVVLVSLDHAETDEILDFLKEARSGSLPVLWDTEGEMMPSYEFFNLPTNVLIGPDGKVLLGWQGYLPAKLAELEVRLKQLGAGGGFGK